MASHLLSLPLEVFELIAAYLSKLDVSSVSRTSRDHYFATQHLLYQEITLTSNRSLIKLTGTLMSFPVVSRLSAKQQLHWYKLADDQLREREVKHLSIQLETEKQKLRITGVILERCINAIARHSPLVQIRLYLIGTWGNFTRQMLTACFPAVVDLTIYIGSGREKIDSQRAKIWDLLLSGMHFPDLRTISFNTATEHPEYLPITLSQTWERMDQTCNKAPRMVEHEPCSDFSALSKMQQLVLDMNEFVTPRFLKMLLASQVTPTRLTRLVISDCPALHAVRDIGFVIEFLRRVSGPLRHLKLHMMGLHSETLDKVARQHDANVKAHPDYHLCAIISKMEPTLQSMDVSLPFMCRRVWNLLPTQLASADGALSASLVPSELLTTLNSRIVSTKYRNRRLIVRHKFCGDDTWEDMATHFNSYQRSEKSGWCLFSVADNKVIWHDSGGSPVVYQPVNGAMAFRRSLGD